MGVRGRRRGRVGAPFVAGPLALAFGDCLIGQCQYGRCRGELLAGDGTHWRLQPKDGCEDRYQSTPSSHKAQRSKAPIQDRSIVPFCHEVDTLRGPALYLHGSRSRKRCGRGTGKPGSLRPRLRGDLLHDGHRSIDELVELELADAGECDCNAALPGRGPLRGDRTAL
jgi:hypothetical protein